MPKQIIRFTVRKGQAMKIDTRLRALEQIAATAKKTGQHLTIFLMNSELEAVCGADRAKMVLDSPMEAVDRAEEIIRKKQPGFVVFDFCLDDLLDLFPDWRESFTEPIMTANITTGDFYHTLAVDGFTLRQLVLYHHVSMMGCPTISNKEKGINYTREDFDRMAKDEDKLFITLALIMRINRDWEALHK